MSIPTVGNSSHIHTPHNGAKASASPFIKSIKYNEVHRIVFTFNPGRIDCAVHYNDGIVPHVTTWATIEDGRSKLQALANSLALMEWPSLSVFVTDRPTVSYFGPKCEILNNIKADRRAEIQTLYEKTKHNIGDWATFWDIRNTTYNALEDKHATAHDLEEVLSELTAVAVEFGVEVEPC